MADSIFTKIIKGELPAYKIYEDKKTLAFLSIHPKTDGHTVVVPKVQVATVWELGPADYQALMQTSRNVAKRLQQVLKPKRVGAQVVGIDIAHAHVHIFPFDTMDEYMFEPDQAGPINHARLSEVAKKLVFKEVES